VLGIVPSAGKGKRIGGDKPYLLIKDKPVLAHTLISLESLPFLSRIILVVEKSRIRFCEQEIIKRYGLKKPYEVIEGGKERFDSVYRGLTRIGKEEMVFIHDGVRPLLSAEIGEKLLRAGRIYKAATIGFPCSETVKEIKKGMFVKKTLERKRIYLIQTPQVFQRDLLIQAYKEARKRGKKANDDAELVEQIGHPVKVIRGEYRNIKITYPEDLIFAQEMLSRRRMVLTEEQ